jgi:hypothetical protein
MHHHTDAQIRCILALMITHLMRRQAAHAGLKMFVRAMLDALAGIEQTVLLYPGDRGRPKARCMITDMDDIQQKLYKIFELHRWVRLGWRSPADHAVSAPRRVGVRCLCRGPRRTARTGKRRGPR